MLDLFMKELRINRIVRQTRTEGFGNRYCIWVQGCSIRCKGCANREMWDETGGEIYSVASLIEDMEQQGGQIEGITVLGGEPFEQSGGLLELVKCCKEKGYTVILFTGFFYEQLLKQPEKREILSYTDLLIDGPYMEDKRDFTRPWVGSSNQKYIFLSERYSEKDLKEIKNKLEIRISKEGGVWVNGMGNINK